MPRVLIVEDEAVVALDLEETLQALGHEVVGRCDTAASATRAALERRPDLVLMDIRLRDGSDGVAAGDHIGRAMGLPVVYLTAHSDEETFARAGRTLPYGFLRKPVDEVNLRIAVELAVNRAGATRAEARAARARHLETVHALGRGVARRLSDLLTPIVGYAELLEARLRGEPAERAMVAEIVRSAHEAADLLRRVYAFSARAGATPELVELATLAASAAAARGARLGPCAGSRVLADPRLLRDALDALLENAADAGATADVCVLAEPGFAVLEISDDGPGMSPAALRRAAEPFFTTREGRAGLGLSTAAGVAESLGGRLELDSAPGRGTVARLVLPAAPH